jgi:uncharacterized protein YsxB (DUF464 family)
MTTINIVKSDAFGYIKIEAVDHAEDAIVCAGISAITQGLAGALLNIEPKPHIEKLIIESGKFEVEIRPMVQEEDMKIIDAVFFTAHVTLAQIQKKYPQMVVINIL